MERIIIETTVDGQPARLVHECAAVALNSWIMPDYVLVMGRLPAKAEPSVSNMAFPAQTVPELSDIGAGEHG